MEDRKIRERELHKKLAQEYDANREGTTNGRYYSKKWIREIIKKANLHPNSRILDIGCGTGILYEVLKEENYRFKYTGIDLSEDMINVGKKRYNIDLRVMDCENLEFKDNEFDVIFMRSVLHHVPNPIKAIQEMRRVSKGKIIISEPSKNIITEFPRYLSKKFTDHFDEDHTHFTKKQLKEFIEKTDIKNYKLIHFGYLAYPFGFTDIVPGTKFLPLSILKLFFKIDKMISKIPPINYFSWHIICVI